MPVCIGPPLGVALRRGRETYETAALPLSYVGAGGILAGRLTLGETPIGAVGGPSACERADRDLRHAIGPHERKPGPGDDAQHGGAVAGHDRLQLEQVRGGPVDDGRR